MSKEYKRYELQSTNNDKDGMKETLESVFMGLPDGCALKNTNSYNSNRYQCTYKENSSKNSERTYGDTPKEAVIKMAELLAAKHNNVNKEK